MYIYIIKFYTLFTFIIILAISWLSHRVITLVHEWSQGEVSVIPTLKTCEWPEEEARMRLGQSTTPMHEVYHLHLSQETIVADWPKNTNIICT